MTKKVHFAFVSVKHFSMSLESTKGITDKRRSARLAQIFSSERGGKPDAEWCSVEDFPPKCGQKRCVKMVVPNLSVLPKMENLKWNDENVENSSLTEILSLVRIVSVD